MARRKLGECVFSCLSECDQYGLKSVAIPAISCGVFGGKASECVPIIVEAIHSYFENQESCVKKVCIFLFFASSECSAQQGFEVALNFSLWLYIVFLWKK